MNEILMPINEDFLEVFDTFMDNNQKNKIRANNVRQYTEGIIDLLLRDEITPFLNENENYSDLSWKRKLKIIEEKYDKNIASNIRYIFKIGGDGSHFSGKVGNNELNKIINNAIHIVENIFVKYFLKPEHKFGTENIYTIFSMLPLKHRIYILENVKKEYINQILVDKLALAYIKNKEKNKSNELFDGALKNKIIDFSFYENRKKQLEVLSDNLEKLYDKNKDFEKNPYYSNGIIKDNYLVIGYPTSKDIFETRKAFILFEDWFKTSKDYYPEFINLFFYLMQTDNRNYNK